MDSVELERNYRADATEPRSNDAVVVDDDSGEMMISSESNEDSKIPSWKDARKTGQLEYEKIQKQYHSQIYANLFLNVDVTTEKFMNDNRLKMQKNGILISEIDHAAGDGQLKTQKSVVGSEPLCVVCATNEKNLLFLPCFHLVCCMSCTLQMIEMELKKDANFEFGCPCCRKNVTKCIRIFS